MEEMQEMMLFILQAVIAAAVPVLTAYLVRWLNSLKLKVIASVDKDKYNTIKMLVEIAVKAAEQAGLKENILAVGEDKKSFAMTKLQAMLNARGLSYISVDEIEAWIEAALLKGWESADVELLDYGYATILPTMDDLIED